MADKIELPKTIWLQINDEDTTWCEDKINDDDVEYTRSDTIKDKNDTSHEALKTLLDVFDRCEAGYPPNIEIRFLAKALAEIALSEDLRSNKKAGD